MSNSPHETSSSEQQAASQVNMEIVHTGDLTYDATQLMHRGSGFAFEELFLGDEADVPNNYYFILGR